MRWLSQYQLFLFDLDGLLVNTEELHFRAYQKMLAQRGYELPWDFAAYFQIAQQDAVAPQREIYKQFPALQREEPNWDVLYAEKKEAYRTILQDEPAPLLPGVDALLTYLHEKNLQRCVVTHTSRPLVDIIRAKNPLLNTIPHWFCREDYASAKPSPDGYLKAIDTLAETGWSIVGFEDSLRGMNALLQTDATPVLVNSMDQKLRDYFARQGVRVLKSFEGIVDLH